MKNTTGGHLGRNIDSIYLGKVITCRHYDKSGDDYLRIHLYNGTNDYSLFETLRNVRGANQGELYLQLHSRVYTANGVPSKRRWKLQGGSKGHITKLWQLTDHHAYGDIKGSKDLVLVYSDTGFKAPEMTSFQFLIAKGKKNDTGFIHLWINGEFDEEIDRVINQLRNDH